MPKVLPEYLELRRQQILDAAASCFASRGFHQTTMQDICDQADLSPGAVYRYFKSKVEIIQAMCSHGHEEDVETIEAMTAGGDTESVLDQLVEAFIVGVENRELCALNVELLSEARRDPFVQETQREGNTAIIEALERFVRKAQDAGQMNPRLDSLAIARVMMGVYQGLVNQRVLEPDLDVRPYAEVVRALFGGDFWTGRLPEEQRPAPRNVLQH